MLNLVCVNVSEFCSTDLKLFVLIELNCSADFALQFGKAWKRIFVDCELKFCNTFVLTRDNGLYLFVEKSL